MALANLGDLELEWAEFVYNRPGKRSTWSQDQKWRADNSGKFDLLLAYRAGGARPDFSAALQGSPERRMLAHLDAYLKAKGTVTPDPTAHELPTRIVTVPTGSQAYWLVHDSETTEIMPDGQSRDKHRTLRWSPGGKYEARRMVALLGFKLISGYPGRAFDWHTSPADPGGGWTPPGNPSGVAPLAIDYWGPNFVSTSGATGLMLVAQPQNVDGATFHYQILSAAEMEARKGTWVWVWVDGVWARRPAGALKAWVAGEDTPRVNVSGIHTHWDTETMVTFWEGAYDSGLMDSRCDIEIAATRFGRTPQECYEDEPVFYVAEPAGVAGGSSVMSPVRLSTEAAVPAPLSWS